MRLNNSGGYLGIGTTAPISSLHINSPTTNGNALYIEQDNSSMSNFINLTTNANAGKMYIGMDNSGGIGLFGSGVAYAASIGTPNATALVFATNDIVRASITSAGSFSVVGTMSKGGGIFAIVHPNPAMASEGYRLRHCFIESPTRSDNIYRFTVTTQNLTGSSPSHCPIIILSSIKIPKFGCP